MTCWVTLTDPFFFLNLLLKLFILCMCVHVHFYHSIGFRCKRTTCRSCPLFWQVCPRNRTPKVARPGRTCLIHWAILPALCSFLRKSLSVWPRLASCPFALVSPRARIACFQHCSSPLYYSRLPAAFMNCAIKYTLWNSVGNWTFTFFFLIGISNKRAGACLLVWLSILSSQSHCCEQGW